jgi:hypothetical protein
MIRYYKLIGKRVFPCKDISEARWDANRTIRSTRLPGLWISTVFLPMDHGYGENAFPLVFETMIFGGPEDQSYCERYDHYKGAVKGHNEAIAYCHRGNFKSWFTVRAMRGGRVSWKKQRYLERKALHDQMGKWRKERDEAKKIPELVEVRGNEPLENRSCFGRRLPLRDIREDLINGLNSAE